MISYQEMQDLFTGSSIINGHFTTATHLYQHAIYESTISCEDSHIRVSAKLYFKTSIYN